MKTIKDQLEKLPDGYRERALNNLDFYMKYDKTCSIDDALLIAFSWAQSPEGDAFWRSVYVHYCDSKQYSLPPLPDKDRLLDKTGFRKIYDVSCKSWREKISDWFSELLVKDIVRVTDSQYKAMREAVRTSEQHKVLDEVFGVEKETEMMFTDEGLKRLTGIVVNSDSCPYDMYEKTPGQDPKEKAQWINQHLTDYLNKNH